MEDDDGQEKLSNRQEKKMKKMTKKEKEQKVEWINKFTIFLKCYFFQLFHTPQKLKMNLEFIPENFSYCFSAISVFML